MEYKNIIGTAMTCSMIASMLLVCSNVSKTKYETGIVCEKHDGTIYVSPINNELVNRKIDFIGSDAKYSAVYDLTNVGDTLRFYNPDHKSIVNAGEVYNGVQINGKKINQIKRELNNVKKQSMERHR